MFSLISKENISNLPSSEVDSVCMQRSRLIRLSCFSLIESIFNLKLESYLIFLIYNKEVILYNKNNKKTM